MADTETDTDQVEVTFIKQKVFHDGTSMQVKKAGESLPVDRVRVQGFIDEGAIDAPEGWDEAIATKNDTAVADGGFTTAPPGGSDENDLKQLDHDDDGEPGGSKPADPPALTGKVKAELLAIAHDEDVTVEDNATNAEIVAAIEAKRAEAEDEGAPA